MTPPSLFSAPVVVLQRRAGAVVRAFMRGSDMDADHSPLLDPRGTELAQLRRESRARSDVVTPDGGAHVRVVHKSVHEIEIHDPDGTILAVVFLRFRTPRQGRFEFHTPSPKRYKRSVVRWGRQVDEQFLAGEGGATGARIVDMEGRTVATVRVLEEYRVEMRVEPVSAELRRLLVGFLCSYGEPGWVKPPRHSGP